MSDILTKKKDLQKQLRDLEKLEKKELQQFHYPAIKKQFEGKYFKRENSYSGDRKPWWLYTKVTQIKPEDVYDLGEGRVSSHFTGFYFQIDCEGKIDISQKEWGYVHCLGEEITEHEFNTAWNKMIEKINELK